MASILPQGPDLIGSALGGLLPGLMQQLNQQNQQGDLLNILGGSPLLALLGGGKGGGMGDAQMQQLMKIAQEAGLENTDEFQKLLGDSDLFKGQGGGQSSLLQMLFNPGINQLRELFGGQ